MVTIGAILTNNFQICQNLLNEHTQEESPFKTIYLGRFNVLSIDPTYIYFLVYKDSYKIRDFPRPDLGPNDGPFPIQK